MRWSPSQGGLVCDHFISQFTRDELVCSNWFSWPCLINMFCYNTHTTITGSWRENIHDNEAIVNLMKISRMQKRFGLHYTFVPQLPWNQRATHITFLCLHFTSFCHSIHWEFLIWLYGIIFQNFFKNFSKLFWLIAYIMLIFGVLGLSHDVLHSSGLNIT